MDVARRAGVSFANVEVLCSDTAEHRRRIETRAQASAWRSVTWQDVVMREYHQWISPRIAIDTAHVSVQDAVAAIRSSLPGA